jgi:hypothetical protein
MIATTFASDTPLVISGWVRDHGIWKNWIWWNLAIATGLTVFLFARYWRRGEIMTTAELSELRYGGRSASVLRGFLGVYQQVTNAIILEELGHGANITRNQALLVKMRALMNAALNEGRQVRFDEPEHLTALLDKALVELEQEGGAAEEPDAAAALTQRYR